MSGKSAPFLWNPKAPPGRQVELVRFVNPEDSFVKEIKRAGERTLAGSLGNGEYYGLASQPCDGVAADLTVASLLWALRFAIDPQLDPIPHYMAIHSPQRIRSPKEIREEGKGICIDLTCLFAAALLQCRHYPLIVILERRTRAGAWWPRHSILGYWRSWYARERFLQKREGNPDSEEHPAAVLERDHFDDLCNGEPAEEPIGYVETLWSTKPSKPPAAGAAFPADSDFRLAYNALGPGRSRIRYAVDVYHAARSLKLDGFDPVQRPLSIPVIADLLEKRCHESDLARKVRATAPTNERMIRLLLLEILAAASRAEGYRAHEWESTLAFLRRLPDFPAKLTRTIRQALSAPPRHALAKLRGALGDLVYWWAAS